MCTCMRARLRTALRVRCAGFPPYSGIHSTRFRPFLLGRQKGNVHQRNEGLTNEMKAINIQARERTSLIGAYIEIVEIGAR